LSDVKWIKIVTDIFDDEKILLIESMPDADSIIVIWFKLLCLAGKQNNDGVLIMNNRIPYSDEMLAHIFRRPLNTIRLALKAFEQYGMIEIVNKTITIPNWSKHQQLDSLEKKRERQREWIADKREKQRQIANVGDMSTSTHVDMSTPVDALEREGDKEEEGDIDITDSKESVRRPILARRDSDRIMDAWNSLGFNQVSSLKEGSKRVNSLRARINEYGVDGVVEAINRIQKSSFLRGQNKSGWTITFEWFVKPNNFIKVLEGQYDDRVGAAAQQSTRYSYDDA